MQINYTELINVIIALALFWLALRDKINGYLFALFTYGSLYFAHTAFLLVIGAPLFEISAMHAAGKGGGNLAKVTTIVFLAAAVSQPLSRSIKNKLFDLNVIYIFGATIVFIGFGYYLNFRGGDWLQMQNVISIQAMLLLILMGYSASGECRLEWPTKARIIAAVNVMLAAAVAVAVYELFSERAWSGTLYASGVRVNRASSLFFNPNLYAFWAALMYLMFSFFYHNEVKHRFWIFTGMFLSTISICLSGGRSSALILFILLGLLGLGGRVGRIERRWGPFVAFLLICSLLYLLARSALAIDFIGQNGWQSILLLEERIATTPWEVLKYALYKLSLGSYVNLIATFLGDQVVTVSPQIVESIEGRFVSASSDSGYIAMYKDSGWLGLAALIGIWFVLAVWSIRSILIKRDIFSIYSLCILMYFILCGFSMRFQVFPVWLFVGIGLVPCLTYWRNGKKS